MQTKRFLMAGAASVMIAGSSMLAGVAYGTSSQPRDCDSNSVMYCGAYTKAEWKTKINNGDTKHSAGNLQQVYFSEGRGITMSDFLSNDTVDGVVKKNGDVIVNGKVVAHNTKSTGRTQMTGSVRSGSLWARPESVSFNTDSIQAYVNMKGGVFHWAILKSCGNTVEGKPVATPTPTPTPTHKPTPTPTPKPSHTPTPTPTPTSTPTPTPTPTTTPLPATGPTSAMAGMVGLGSLGYAARAYVRSRKSLIDTLKRK